jgi:hypothetical protein
MSSVARMTPESRSGSYDGYFGFIGILAQQEAELPFCPYSCPKRSPELTPCAPEKWTTQRTLSLFRTSRISVIWRAPNCFEDCQRWLTLREQTWVNSAEHRSSCCLNPNRVGVLSERQGEPLSRIMRSVPTSYTHNNNRKEQAPSLIAQRRLRRSGAA